MFGVIIAFCPIASIYPNFTFTHKLSENRDKDDHQCPTQLSLCFQPYHYPHSDADMEDTPRRSWTHCVVDQYVKEVTDFSSQYGSDGSISYVANNIIGKPTLYPDYGDFSAAYCLVT